MRKVCFLSATALCSALFLTHGALAATIYSTFTLGTGDATVQQIGLGNDSNGWQTAGTPGAFTYNYVAIDFTADASGSYTFGQSSGTVDSAMAVYLNNTFDLSALTNPNAYNDDSHNTYTCGTSGRCPAVSTTLTAGQVNTLIITTYAQGASLELPLGFFSDGAGNISFSVNASSNSSEYFVPVSTAGLSDGMAGVMDGIKSGSTSASSGLSDALNTLSSGSESERAEALRNITPNAGVVLTNVATQVMQGGFARVDGRLNSVRNAMNSGPSASTSTHGSSYVSAYADDGSNEKSSRFDGFEEFENNSKSLSTAKGENNDNGLSLIDRYLKPNSLWAQVYGFKSTQDSDDGYAGYKSTGQSYMVGFDVTPTANSIVGVALGYSRADVNMSDFRTGDTSNVDSYQVTLYGSQQFAEEWVFEGKLSYARHEISGSRSTSIGTAQSSYGINQLGAQADISRTVSFGNGISVKPRAGLSYMNYSQEGYSESGSTLSQTFDGVTSERVYSTISIEAQKSFVFDDNTIITPIVSAGWSHEFLADGINLTSRFSGGGASFSTSGQDLTADSFSLAAGFEINHQKNLQVDLGLNGEFAKNYREYGAKARVSYTF